MLDQLIACLEHFNASIDIAYEKLDFSYHLMVEISCSDLGLNWVQIELIETQFHMELAHNEIGLYLEEDLFFA